MAPLLFAAACLISLTAASFDGNINYQSPSRRHIGLGIDVPKVAKRSLVKRATPWDPAQLNFTHGVASGDPYPHSVILWTRIAPSLEADRSNVTVSGYVPFYSHETEKYIKASPNPICVEYRVGTDGNFSSVVDKGTAYTTSDIDFTVKACIMFHLRIIFIILTSDRLRQRTWHPSRPTSTSSMCVVQTRKAQLDAPRLVQTKTTAFQKLVSRFSRVAIIPMDTSTRTAMLPARTR
jgi:hypothetical protein